jgi:PIN domain nuclease of toxin-antitoxin system
MPRRGGRHRSRQDGTFSGLPITLKMATRAGSLPGPHKDPFDRLLVAQALAENIPIVSNDRALDGYGLTRIW